MVISQTSTNLIRIIQEVQPDEIYNLGAMSHVKVSFDSPEYVANTDSIGTLRLLEAIRILGLTHNKQEYIKRLHQNFMVDYQKIKIRMVFTMRLLHFIHVLLTELQKFMLTGLL